MGNIQFNNNKILFVDGKIAFGADCCCDVCNNCVNCEEGFDCTLPEITVTLPALENTGRCSNCAEYATDWVVPRDANDSGNACKWHSYQFEGGSICLEQAGLGVVISGSTVTVRMGTGVAWEMQWQKTYIGGIQCTDFVNEEIPFDFEAGSANQCLNPDDLPVFLTM